MISIDLARRPLKAAWATARTTAFTSACTLALVAACGGGGIGEGGGPETLQGEDTGQRGAPLTRVAGLGPAGRADGTVGDVLAAFAGPTGLGWSATGMLVADSGQHLLRRVTPGGVVSTLAGTGRAGQDDGPAHQATLDTPVAVAAAGDGSVWVIDRQGSVLRRLGTDGRLRTLALGAYELVDAHAVAGGPAGEAYVADAGAGRLLRVGADGAVKVLRDDLQAPGGVAVDAQGRVYVSDTGRHVIRRFQGGSWEVYAGQEDSPGWLDDQRAASQFFEPRLLALAPDGLLWVQDSGNGVMRAVPDSGSVVADFTMPTTQGGYGVDSGGVLWASDTQANTLVRLQYQQSGTFLRPVAGGGLSGSLFRDAQGAVNVIETEHYVMRRLGPQGADIVVGSGLQGGGTFGPVLQIGLNTPRMALQGQDGDVLILDSYGIAVTRVKDGVTSSFIGHSDVMWPSVHAAMGQQQAIADAPGDWYYYAGQTGLTRLHKKTGLEGEPLASMAQVFSSVRGSVYTTERRGVFDDGLGQLDTPTPRLFQSLRGLVVDAAGNAYVSDEQDHAIRMVIVEGLAPGQPARVVTLAGLGPGTAGDSDGRGRAAGFNRPAGLLLQADGSLLVADRGNQRIRRIEIDRTGPLPVGVVSTVAGSSVGRADGPALQAQFNQPQALLADGDGVLIFDGGNLRLRRLAGGQVSTVAALGSQHTTVKTPPDGNGLDPRLGSPGGMAWLPDGRLAVADTGNHLVRTLRLAAGGAQLDTWAGAGVAGLADGAGLDARFALPEALAADGQGNVIVADTANHALRWLTPDGRTTTLAGGAAGFADGPAAQARFNAPGGIAISADGRRIVVADRNNHRIRELLKDAGGKWTARTLAGSGQAGRADGTGSAASFRLPAGVALAPNGDVLVADTDNNLIRRIDTDGRVTTVAGSGEGSLDGSAMQAQFRQPQNLVLDAQGRIVVADTGNNLLRLIAADGRVSRIAGLPPPYLDNSRTPTPTNSPLHAPTGLAVGSDGRLYVASSGYNQIVSVALP